MKIARLALCGMAWLMFAMLVMPAGILAQDTEDSGQAYRFNKEELTQMLAPIALYPDSLTAQILMASTYPLEVVEADRWRNQNRQLTESELDSALQDKPWDPSIKSLCHFPEILSSMSDKLDQTRKLGDTFLGQEEEVMATVQELRRKAEGQGNLKSTNEQKVIVEREIIRIEPSNPEVVYVPVYDPAYVYGPWWYPAYPPYYWYYPPGFYNGVSISFGPGIFLGFNLFSWAWFDWGTHRIHTDINRTSQFHHHNIDRRNNAGAGWRHNPTHRRGVAYRDGRTSERFGSRPPRLAPLNQDRRGYSQRSNIERQQQRPSQTMPRVRTEPVRPQRPAVQNTPFRGIGEGGFERRAGERGGISNRGADIKQPNAARIGGMRRPESGSPRGGQIQNQQSVGPSGGQQQRQEGGGGSRGSGQGGGSRK